MDDLLRPTNPVFAGYAFYASILIIKMFLMSYLTALQRYRKKKLKNVPVTFGVLIWKTVMSLKKRRVAQKLKNVPVTFGVLIWKTVMSLKKRRVAQAFVNVEDAIAAGVDIKPDDQDVERVRRAHMNDLENIPIFLVSGLLFVMIDPNPVFALMCFRLYAVARFMHTIVYAVVVVRQPARTLCFNMGLIINFIILCAIISHCMQL